MKIGVLPAIGSGYQTMARTGQGGRLKRYIRWYEQIGEVRYFSYLEEADYITDASHTWPIRFPGLSPKQYALLLPFIQPALRECSVLRCMNLLAAVPAIVARVFFGIPFVVSYGADYPAIAAIHGDHRQIRKWRWLRRVAFKLAAAVLVPSHPMAERFRVEYPYANIRWQPNWVDCQLFSPSPSGLQPGVILYVGRFVAEKNLVRAVRVATKLGVEFRCVGEGPEQTALEAAGAKITPPVPWESLPRWYRSAGAFCLPSLSEGHPKVLLEAMASGLPCAVSTRVEGIVGHMRHGCLFDPEDEAEMAMAFWILLNQHSLANKLGQAARQEAVAQYDEQILMPRELALLHEVAR